VRLRELKIKNFRKLEDLTVIFPKGLCVIVGENNTGKTAIIDALRLLLMPSREVDALRITEDDFRNGTDGAPIEISCSFCDTTDTEEAQSAIICRGNEQLRSVRGQVNYANLKGRTKRLAESAFYRDCRKDYKEAYNGVEEVLRDLIWNDEEWARIDDAPDSSLAERVRETVWKFVKSNQGLPSVSLAGDLWVATMKDRLAALIESLGAPQVPKLGQKIQKRGLEQHQLLLPLFEEQKLFPNGRHETIHQVKGESIGAVLVIGSAKFWNSVISAIALQENNEDRRLAYVAMTRAKDLLVLSLPSNHFDKHVDRWRGWGFDSL
jgi:hypothetical protein